MCLYLLQWFCYHKISFNFIFGLNLISSNYVLGVVILYLCDNDLKVKENVKEKKNQSIHTCMLRVKVL